MQAFLTSTNPQRPSRPKRLCAVLHAMQRRCVFILALCVGMGCMPTRAQAPWFFAVLSDPQMGMYAHDTNSDQEIANFKFAIANLNRLHPRFVVICGDLVNRAGDATEIAEYKSILKTLDPSIPVFNVAGNHDVGNIPTAETLKKYRDAFGRDYYTFTQDGLLGIVLDSNLIRSPEGDPESAKQQEGWMDDQLAAAKATRPKQIVIFQHIPYFVRDPAEADQYFNIPAAARQRVLGKLENAGVHYIFAGHTHKSAVRTEGGITEIITGAAGMPLGGSVSGLRIVRVNGTTLDSTWYCFGAIPNRIDEKGLTATTCPQE